MSAPLASVRVAFGAHEIELRSDSREVIASLSDSFRHMRGEGDGPAFAVAEVIASHGRFRVMPPTGPASLRATARDAIRWARQQVVEGVIRARPDLLWLHGAAVAREGRALLLPGARGRGKSTLATALCQRGWRFLTDDLVPLSPSDLTILPFPRVPEIREDPGEEMPSAWLRDAPKAVFDISPCLSSGAHPVRAIVFPEASRTGDAPALERRTASEAVRLVAEGCWNFATLGVLAPATLSRLVSEAPTMVLSFSASDAAAERLTEWFDETVLAG